MMKQIIASLTLCLMLGISIHAQQRPLTVAESSDFTSTSTYQDVINFINNLKENHPYLAVETIGQSVEGHDIPLLIIANPLPASFKDMQDDDRMVVYIQANIHAGEVEGKEAAQMLARTLLNNPDSEILNNLVVLINPILNPDGNDKISPNNRTNQNGPVNGVGLRYNGQMLDLNRDAMKAETPEIRAVISHVLNTWDPAILVDCHTTNGSFHEEPVTFNWMSNPNGDRSLINFMRDAMMPAVGARLKDTYGFDNCYYGVFLDRMDYDKGWISYASEPRYLVNYMGLRNRLAILNENYVYADFKTRVHGSYALLLSILEYASVHKNDIKKRIAAADEKTIKRGLHPMPSDSFAIRYEAKPTPEMITIKAFETDTIPGVKGYWRYKQSERKRTVTVPYIADYYPSESTAFPYAYVFAVTESAVIELMKLHGIQVEQLAEPKKWFVERFDISELEGSKRLNQGHYSNSVKGAYIQVEQEFPAGTYMVKTAQPLGSLVAALLEPQANDGLLKWNFFDRYLVPQWGDGYYPYPVYRLMRKVD